MKLEILDDSRLLSWSTCCAVRTCQRQELGERGNLALARRLLQRAVQNRITRKGHAQHARDGQSLQLIAPGKETHRVVQHSNYLYKDSTDVKSLLAYTHTAQV